MHHDRYDRLYQELHVALAHTGAEEMKSWGKRSAFRLPGITKRRLKNLGRLVTTLASLAGTELRNAVRAMSEGRFGEHFGGRAAAAIDGTLELGQRITKTVSAMGNALFSDPKANAPGILALALGFVAGSGGFDGDGGIPDTDRALGIGWHRSPLTHSIVAGVVVEGAILALVDLTGIIHDKLPPGYDPFWDKLLAAKESFAARLSQGASAGIAYHLGVDAVLQPGAYHDLPFSMPMEAHQTILAMNAAAEAIDAGHKQSTGEKFVRQASGVAQDGVKALGVGIKELFVGK